MNGYVEAGYVVVLGTLGTYGVTLFVRERAARRRVGGTSIDKTGLRPQSGAAAPELTGVPATAGAPAPGPAGSPVTPSGGDAPAATYQTAEETGPGTTP
jgi:hypothetical protein